MGNLARRRAVLCAMILLLLCGHARALVINPIFSGTWNSTQMAVVNAAIDSWENVIANNQTVSVTFDFTHAGSDYLGQYASTYSYPPGTDLNPWYSGFTHTIHFNLDYTGLWWGTGSVPFDNWDAMSVARHELGHTMGFTSGYLNSSGTDKWTSHITGAVFDPGGLNVSLVSSSDEGHVLDSGATADDLMVPALYNGVRHDVSETDLDMLNLAYGYYVPIYWTGSGSSTWSTASGLNNWRIHRGTTANYVAGSNVTFDDSATGTTATITAANVVPVSVAFNNSTKNFTITGTKGITGATGLLKQGTGKVTLSSVNGYSGVTTLEGGTLQLNKAGARNPVLNLGGANIKAGKMIFDYTGESSPGPTIGALLATSYHSGSATHFDTGKFQSSSADVNHGLGWKDTAGSSQVLVAYTLYGDATVNGIVDISDLSALGQNWNGVGKIWAQGDFNYDGTVDVSDLSALGQHWNQGMAGFSDGIGSDTGAIVPEPGSMILLLSGGAALLCYAWRRRRSCR